MLCQPEQTDERFNDNNIDIKIGQLDKSVRDWDEMTERKVQTMCERIADYANYIEEDRRV